MCTYLKERELSTDIIRLIKAIPKPVYLAFFAAMLANIVCFFHDLALFPIGDHDVGYLGNIPLLSGGRAGRWFIPFLHSLSGHTQIPVWTQLMAFATQIAAAMLFCLLLYPGPGFFPLFVSAILISGMPYVLDFYYHHYMALSFSASQLFMLLSLYFAIDTRRRPVLIFQAISSSTPPRTN